MKSKIILLYIAILYSITMLHAQQSGSLEDTNGTQQEEGCIQGSRIIYSDNFSKDAIGDFPAFCPSTHGAKESKLNYFYISNLVMAEAGKDKRSMVLKDLLEKGSVSTSAIQFATNSDQLTSASSEVIQQFVEAMKEEPTLKLKIIGHTDADGDEAKNLILSKKRTAAVKTKMIVLGITANRSLTDGKGEKEPIADNSAVNGKLQNRRVEFVKL